MVEVVSQNIEYIHKVEINEEESDRLAIVKYSKLRGKSNKDELFGNELMVFKKKLLEHSSEPISEPLLNIKSEILTIQQEKEFIEIAKELNIRLLEIFDANYNLDIGTVNKDYLVKNTKSFILWYKDLSERYSEKKKLCELINIELILQIYKQANWNDFSSELLYSKYVFGFFYIMSHYMHISHQFIKTLKKWLYFLIAKKFLFLI